MENNENNSIKPQVYKESHGTGVLSSILFIVFAIIFMIVISHFIK